MEDKHFQWNLAIEAAIRVIKDQTDSFCCNQQMLKVVRKLEDQKIEISPKNTLQAQAYPRG
ncbi:hypothetical protein LCGC14_0815450 [marine sediment metagenome]|uniref:Uncharacterized protein n=1 Tax=marine sediment metagenome TaxID=412755 RepID=A0A0F9PKE5_9ZZZZ